MNSLIPLIKERFKYDDGKLLYRAVLVTNPSLQGKKAGSLCSNGYRVVNVKGKRYPVAHIIWALFHDELPLEQIDHINHNTLDNHIENLRSCTKTQNGQYRQTPSNNTSGYNGGVLCYVVPLKALEKLELTQRSQHEW